MSGLETKSVLGQIGDFLLLKSLGKGSLGEVFLAEHRFLKKFYTLKVLPNELAQDKKLLQNLEKEVASLALLDHPNIVKLYNFSCVDGKYFLVTDCIHDSSGNAMNLFEYIQEKNGLLEEEEIVQLSKQIASALDYVHQKVVHGESTCYQGIKLNNILIRKNKSGIDAFLSDFGLFFLQKHPFKYINREELYFSFMQSYPFLAPELRSEDFSKNGDEKSDVYAFGVLVYYMIMNHFPDGIFSFPSSKRKDLKYPWDALLYQCLQSEPENRPAKILSLIEETIASKVSQKQVHNWDDLSEILENKLGNKKTSPVKSVKPILKPTELIRPEYESDPASVFQIDNTVVKYTPKRSDNKYQVEPLVTEMVVIEGGAFMRGSQNGGRDEIPRHAIHLSSFAIDVHPVTNEQFVRFLEAMGGEKDGNNNDIIRLRESRIKKAGGKLSIESGYAKHPVVGITWYGALAYAKWIGKRLPTEAEWEIAAYGGVESSQYPTGDNIERSQANFFSSDTTAVMSYPANRYGIFDMAGNVYEWCQDWYAYNYYDLSIQEPDDPKGPLQGVYRVLRGGCWKSLKEDMRCSHRHRNNPGIMNKTYGFRCAADVEGT
ncbi:MAG: bifunctional serine/threonine-protein kinase/formylglycine-generating enzyme family protein [Chlamydiae bacterium]|nr:bifunctional serine/threonine-protein kinase/formylglycine-generating enzyme family protein [Chlamydiota bacterium]